MFEIITLSDRLSGCAQATYNPNNVDVRNYYNDLATYENKIPALYLSWCKTFYQYKTPNSDFVSQCTRFENLSYVDDLYNSLPALVNPKFDPLVKAVQVTTAPDSAEGRQNKFVLLKDHYCLAVIREYFKNGGTMEVANKQNSAILVDARAKAKQNYEYWLEARHKSLSNPNSWFNKWAKPFLAVASIVVSTFIPGGTIFGVSLAAYLTATSDVIKALNLEYDPNTGNVTMNDPNTGKPAEPQSVAPAESGMNILLIGALALGVVAMMKGKK